jgi:hypothetical protein
MQPFQLVIDRVKYLSLPVPLTASTTIESGTVRAMLVDAAWLPGV